MSSIVTRSGKGSPLTHAEVDTNFTNLNTDKYQEGSAIGATTPAAGTFTTLIGGGDSANYGQLTGGATTKAVEFKSLGSDTNVAYAIRSKGTGAIDLAAGSSGVNISNGGTVTAVTRTTQGSNYTSPPTWSASAPTTAGGTTASGTVSLASAPATIQSGGTGYTVGDVLSVVGGTLATGFPAAATYTVATVSSGVITAVAATNFAQYTTPPTNPVSVTGGTGSSATLNLTYGVGSVFTISVAGSGYVEQPTVTFSGGGGSGAAAYAVVGAGTTIKSLGSTLSFYTPNGEAFRVTDTGAAVNGYWQALGGVNNATFRGVASTQVNIQSASAVSIVFATASGTEQMRVSHTASAVNYVQVTGAATVNDPVISAQGSDANLRIILRSKGTLGIRLTSSDGSIQFATTSPTGTSNYLQAAPSAAGSAPILSSQGSDADIDLTLTPKGAGAVRFGTYTGTILTPTGFITIKDSGGTTRRLLVG